MIKIFSVERQTVLIYVKGLNRYTQISFMSQIENTDHCPGTIRTVERVGMGGFWSW